MTFGDMIVLTTLALIICTVIAGAVRNNKKGKHCGCSNCQGCQMARKCHTVQDS